jgi:hypothetical protein
MPLVRRLAALICWLIAAPAAFASGVEFEARLWSPDLSGMAEVGDEPSATAIDLVSDLGFSGDELPEGRLLWRPSRRTSVRLSYSSFDFSGDAQLQRTVTFAGTTFDLDARVASVLELEYGGLGIAWQFLSTPDGRVRVGPVVEARGLRGEAGISTDILGLLPLSATEEFEVAFATAGLVLDVEPTRKLHVYAEWKTTVETDDGDLTDSEAGLRYYPLDLLAVAVGYRRIEIDARDADERFDLELDGPFFGAVLRF